MLYYSCGSSKISVLSALIETCSLSNEWFRLWMKVFHVTWEKDVFTILDYMYHVLQWKFVLQITHAIFYTPMFIHCNPPYSKQEMKSCHKRWKLLIDMSHVYVWWRVHFVIYCYWYIDMLSNEHVQCFSFEYEYKCWIIHFY